MSGKHDLSPHLDLYNFTDPLASDSHYVLTSPRSLEACARHGIKPLQLLPKTMDDFMEELSSTKQQYDPDVLEVMYKKSERERLKILRMCREEREKIIDEKVSHKLLQDKLLNEALENDDEEDIEEIEAPNTWHTLKPTKENEFTPRTSTKVKPSILSFLDQSASPRVRSQRSPRTYGESSNQSSLHGNSFNLVTGSDSEEESYFAREALSQRSVEPVPSWKPPSGKRPQSVSKSKVKKFNINEASAELPSSLKKNLSLMSEKDRRLLDIMMLKAKEEEVKRKVAMSAELSRCEDMTRDQVKRKEERYSQKLKDRDERMNDVRLRKDTMEQEAQLYRETELNVRNSKWQREYDKQMRQKHQKLFEKHTRDIDKKIQQEENLKRLSQDEVWRSAEIDDSMRDHQKKYKTKCKSDSTRKKKAEHDAILHHIEEKELLAQQNFQNQMKQKHLQRNQKKMKEQERKEQHERNLKVLQNDLHLWQKELSEFQDVTGKRTGNVVGHRNAVKSQKVHNKRLEKELNHLAVKAKVEEEQRLRQEELKAMISLKDQRSKLIQQEKEEYTTISRNAARASSAVRDIIKEQTFKSSFAEMAAEAEKMARIERLGQQHKKPSSLGITKNSTTMLLG